MHHFHHQDYRDSLRHIFAQLVILVLLILLILLLLLWLSLLLFWSDYYYCCCYCSVQNLLIEALNSIAWVSIQNLFIYFGTCHFGVFTYQVIQLGCYLCFCPAYITVCSDNYVVTLCWRHVFLFLITCSFCNTVISLRGINKVSSHLSSDLRWLDLSLFTDGRNHNFPLKQTEIRANGMSPQDKTLLLKWKKIWMCWISFEQQAEAWYWYWIIFIICLFFLLCVVWCMCLGLICVEFCVVHVG